MREAPWAGYCWERMPALHALVSYGGRVLTEELQEDFINAHFIKSH